VIKREAGKILKYEELLTEIQCMWNVKAKVIPVIIGATETIPKSLRQYPNNTPGKHQIKELKKKKPAILELNTYYKKCQCKSIKRIAWTK